MGDTLSVTMDSSQTTVQPTLEEEAAKYDTPAPAEERPEWLPEKFKSPEDLAKAYNELQARFSSRNVQSEEEPEEDEDYDELDPSDFEMGEDDQDVEDQARQAVEDAGLDFESLSEKYWQTGELEDDDYASLEEAGIPRRLVDQYIAGQQAILDSQRSSVLSSVGGEEAYGAMTEWAADNLSDKEVDAFNRAVNSNDMDTIMFAVRGLEARYRSEVGGEPSRTVTASNARTGEGVYNSLAELQRDMSDSKYQNDPAFRRMVEQKLGRSDIM